MRILITGATGFIGRSLVPSLAKTHQVRAAVRRTSSPISFPPNVEIVTLPNLVEPIDWMPLLANVDAVVHLAGIAHAGRNVNEITYDRVNRAATGDLAVAAARARVGRFVFISSIAAQTGPSADHVLVENDEPRPANAYGRSKLGAEIAVRKAGVPFTTLRPVLVYGPGVKGNMRAIMRLSALPLPLPFSSLVNQRSLLALNNLVDAIGFVLESSLTVNETFIVADPEPIPFRDIVVILRARKSRNPWLFNIDPAYIKQATCWLGKPELWDRIGGSLVVSTAKLETAGWIPACGTERLLCL